MLMREHCRPLKRLSAVLTCFAHGGGRLSSFMSRTLAQVNSLSGAPLSIVGAPAVRLVAPSRAGSALRSGCYIEETQAAPHGDKRRLFCPGQHPSPGAGKPMAVMGVDAIGYVYLAHNPAQREIVHGDRNPFCGQFLDDGLNGLPVKRFGRVDQELAPVGCGPASILDVFYALDDQSRPGLSDGDCFHSPHCSTL